LLASGGEAGCYIGEHMDLTHAIHWAGQAAVRGSDANRIVLAGLRSLLKTTGQVSITNPLSSARDGVTPDLTRALLCNDGTQRFCVKLYPSCPEGEAALCRHALILSSLKDTLPVPDVVQLLPEADPFGFPALVTTASGRTLDHELPELSAVAQEAIMVNTAVAVAALHNCDPGGLPIDTTYDPDSVLSLWREDAEWYVKNADRAGEAADLVRRGASELARHSKAPPRGSVAHLDLTPYNILAENGAVILVDWDHAGFAAPHEDVGKMLIGLLGMLSLPRVSRLPLARAFLDAYSRETSCSREELFIHSVPFALDTILDWVVGGKNAPREELSWATERILKRDWDKCGLA